MFKRLFIGAGLVASLENVSMLAANFACKLAGIVLRIQGNAQHADFVKDCYRYKSCGWAIWSDCPEMNNKTIKIATDPTVDGIFNSTPTHYSKIYFKYKKTISYEKNIC